MARKHKRLSEEGGINMTPMIDVVFQMIIFFVCTAELERKQFDEKIKLAMSPNGPPVEQKDPRTITVEVTKDGAIKIARQRYSYPAFQSVLRKAVRQYGQTIPVVIRGDAQTKHEDIRRVMDICAGAGLWKVKFAAVKEQAAVVE